MYLVIIFFLQTLPPLILIFSEPTLHKNPSPRTGSQDLLVRHYDCEENEQKTLHKYAINQLTQCESKTQEIETKNVLAKLYSKARATTLTIVNSKQHFQRKITMFPRLKWKQK